MPPETTIAAAVAILTERMIGALVVTGENGSLAGIISERDIVRGLAEQGAAFLDCPIDTCMASPVETCAPGDSDREILALMTDRRFRHLPVVEDGRLIGIVSIGDVVKSRIGRGDGRGGRAARLHRARLSGWPRRGFSSKAGWSTTTTATATARRRSISWSRGRGSPLSAPTFGPHSRGQPPPARVIDARRRLVVPGFVNAHYHSHDVLLKGVFDPMPLQMWFVNALPPQYPIRSAEEVRARTLLGAAECLLAGITTVQDMLTLYPFDDALLDAVLEAYDEIGIRTVFSLQIGDRRAVDRIPHWREIVPEAYHSLSRLAGRRGGRREARSTWCAGRSTGSAWNASVFHGRSARPARSCPRPNCWPASPSSPTGTAFRCSPTCMNRGPRSSPRVPISPPIPARRSNTSAPPVCSAPASPLAHSIWFAEDEIAALAEAGARVVLNPASNMKSKSGVAPIQRYRKAGVEIALGCDNCACSDVQNMFQSMKLFCGLAAISDTALDTPDAPEAMRAATLGGAAAVGLAGKIGALAPGMRADLCLYDLDRPTLLPLNSAARQMVYTETGSALDTVMVEGRTVVEGGRLVSIDAAALRDSVEAIIGGLRADQHEVAARFETIRPYLVEAWHKSWDTDIGMDRYVGDGPR